jgi:hypothetical protein
MNRVQRRLVEDIARLNGGPMMADAAEEEREREKEKDW